MNNHNRTDRLTAELNAAVAAKDAVLMAGIYEELCIAHVEEFREDDFCYATLHSYTEAAIAMLKYLAFNNMYGMAMKEGKKNLEMLDFLVVHGGYSKREKTCLKEMRDRIDAIIRPLKKHRNMVVPRLDTRCTLCRKRPANKTGSHMVPNFLAHPTFSWDGKGKRGHEALNHTFLNAGEKFCTFYGNAVPQERFAQGEGKTEVSDEDIEKNINQLEYDNEFCSVCEERFGILETAYAQYYNGIQKSINPRIAYLFWLSVLWRMSMGSMGVFMDVGDELELREILDRNITGSVKDIATGITDLGDWKYAMYRVEGMRDGDTGILVSRQEKAPYVVTYNDVVMLFYRNTPADEELTVGPIAVERANLNDWHSPEKAVTIDRRKFWDVRDWIVATSYDYHDPVRERVLIAIREEERKNGKVIDARTKQEAIKVQRTLSPPKQKMYRLHKFERIYIAWTRKNEAKEKGEVYDPLKDDEIFITQNDMNIYYNDLAALSRSGHPAIDTFPFYCEAREALPDAAMWTPQKDESNSDPEYTDAVASMLGSMSPKEIDRMLNGIPEPYTNPSRNIGRNDPCPCGSGKKYKKCCGRGD